MTRPAILPMPASVLKLLLGDRAYLLLGGQQVLPARLLAAGFHFTHPEIAEALQASL